VLGPDCFVEVACLLLIAKNLRFSCGFYVTSIGFTTHVAIMNLTAI
jgi:hypothetical protein